MPLTINLRHLERADARMEGTLTPAELELENLDELITAAGPLSYAVVVERSDENLLVSGKLAIELECQCARCLAPFRYNLELDPWHALIPLSGEECAPVVNDSVDLTPFVREDILLEFPQHPLCKPECGGLPKAKQMSVPRPAESGPAGTASPAWDKLNKLKL